MEGKYIAGLGAGKHRGSQMRIIFAILSVLAVGNLVTQMVVGATHLELTGYALLAAMMVGGLRLVDASRTTCVRTWARLRFDAAEPFLLLSL